MDDGILNEDALNLRKPGPPGEPEDPPTSLVADEAQLAVPEKPPSFPLRHSIF